MWRPSPPTAPDCCAASCNRHGRPHSSARAVVARCLAWLWTELKRLGLPVICIDARHAPSANANFLGYKRRKGATILCAVGEGEGQIAEVILRGARALLPKSARGRGQKSLLLCHGRYASPQVSDGKLGPRFYVICRSGRSFRAISAGHGGGRNLKGIADFANGKRCAKNFGNALDSRLTAGGAYVTAETKTSFKGYYRASAKQDAVLIRSFVRFDGEGEVANVRH